MAENRNQPGEYDAVLGGIIPAPVGAVVLGGVEGVKSRLKCPVAEVRAIAISEAPKYGEAGLELAIAGLIVSGDRDYTIKVWGVR